MDILGIKFANVTMDEAVAQAENCRIVFTPNPEIVWIAQKNKKLKTALEQADMLLPDGIGIVIASKIKRKPLKERVAGFDFFTQLLNNGKKVFLFGSKPGVAEKVNLPNIVGRHHGYFSEEDNQAIIDSINASGAEVLAVCLGAPKQEIWIVENIDKLNVKLAIGLGGAIDVLAGEVKRAPRGWQKMGLEWLYRALKEPKRFKRLAVLPLFLWRVLWHK